MRSEPLQGPVLGVDPSPQGGYWVVLSGDEVVGWGRWDGLPLSLDGIPDGLVRIGVEVPMRTPVWTGDRGMALLETAFSAGVIFQTLSKLGTVYLTTPGEWRRVVLGKRTQDKASVIRRMMEYRGIRLPPRGRGFTSHHLDALGVAEYIRWGGGWPLKEVKSRHGTDSQGD